MSITSVESMDQNRSEVPAQTMATNIYGRLISLCKETEQSFVVKEFTTLNERFKIFADRSLGLKNGKDFKHHYFIAGVRGNKCVGVHPVLGSSLMTTHQHQPIDMCLFTPIPLIVRRLDEPLDNLTRGKYRLREIKNIDGVEHEVYWAKRINFDIYDPETFIITRDENQNESPVPHTPIKDDLENVQPVELTSVGTVPTTNTYANASATLDCSLDQNDIQELQNACRIMYGDASVASISELATVWGVDTSVHGSGPAGTQISYDEILSATVYHMVCERDGRNAQANTGLNLKFDHGSSEPLLLHTVSTIMP